MSDELQKVDGTEITVEFDSREHVADPLAVAKTLTAIDSLIKEAHQAFEANSKLLLKARPFEKSSFDMPFVLELFGVAALAQYPTIENIINIVKQYFEIKKQLKGDKPNIKDSQTIIIQGNEIRVEQATLNFLTPNNKSDKLVSEAFEEIIKDTSIKDVNIIKKNTKKPLATIKRKEFAYYMPQKVVSVPEEQKGKRVTVKVLAPFLDNSSRWVLDLDGKHIYAKLTDDIYADLVKNRVEKFANGDKLDLDLQFIRQYDIDSETHKDTNYVVTKIWEHIQPPDKPLLFDGH